MTTIEAVYENGVFRPLGKVNLPEHSHVQLSVNRWPVIPADHPQAKLWQALSYRGEGDDSKSAERHNEHQP